MLTTDRKGDLVGDTLPAGIAVSRIDQQALTRDGVIGGNVGNIVFAAASTTRSHAATAGRARALLI